MTSSRSGRKQNKDVNYKPSDEENSFDFPEDSKFKLCDEVFVGSEEKTKQGVVAGIKITQVVNYKVNLYPISEEKSEYYDETKLTKVGKFKLDDDVFAGGAKCGKIAGILREQPLRYLVNLYPFPEADKRYYDEDQLTKVIDSKEQLLWAQNENIDMEVSTISTLRGIEAVNRWEIKNPKKYEILQSFVEDESL